VKKWLTQTPKKYSGPWGDLGDIGHYPGKCFLRHFTQPDIPAVPDTGSAGNITPVGGLKVNFCQVSYRSMQPDVIPILINSETGARG
jgi:hypothetical protein